MKLREFYIGGMVLIYARRSISEKYFYERVFLA